MHRNVWEFCLWLSHGPLWTQVKPLYFLFLSVLVSVCGSALYLHSLLKWSRRTTIVFTDWWTAGHSYHETTTSHISDAVIQAPLLIDIKMDTYTSWQMTYNSFRKGGNGGLKIPGKGRRSRWSPISHRITSLYFPPFFFFLLAMACFLPKGTGEHFDNVIS